MNNRQSNLYRYYTVKRTQIEMLYDRGYDVSADMPFMEMDIDQFIQYSNDVVNGGQAINEALSSVYTKQNGETNSTAIVIFLHKDARKTTVSKEIVTKFSDDIRVQASKYTTPRIEIIIIVDSGFSSEAEKVLKALDGTVFDDSVLRLQIFKETMLTYNPTKFIDYRVHEFIEKEEADAIIKKMGVSIRELPALKEDDPVCAYFGWRKGSLIRIYRDDPLDIAGAKHIYYRSVIA